MIFGWNEEMRYISIYIHTIVVQFLVSKGTFALSIFILIFGSG
jgi:hypothetical protein